MDDTADARTGSLAELQHGLISAAQAQRAGLSRTQIRHRVATGRWIRVERGVYRISGVPVSRVQRLMVAVLARPDGAISHLNAAELAGLDIAGPPKPWLTVPPSASARSSVARIYRTDLPPEQVTTVAGIRTTIGARTIVDCCSLLGPKRLARMVDQAMHRRLTTAAAIDEILAANRDPSLVRAHDALRDALDLWRPTIVPDSPAEARFIRILGEWGFPPPERQIRVRDEAGVVIARLDGGWPDRRVGYEYDSVEWHGPARWASDESRHAAIEALGWTLLHVDKADLLPGATALRTRFTAVLGLQPVLT